MILFRRAMRTSDQPEETENYLISSSDLMIGLLFIFIILVVSLSVKIQKTGKLEDPMGNFMTILDQKAKQRGSTIKIDPKTGVITLHSDGLFDTGKAILKPEGIQEILDIRKDLADMLPCYITYEQSKQKCLQNPTLATIETVFIEGHTDSKPMNHPLYNNWHLGLDRARAVYQVLAGDGLSEYKNERGQPIFGFSSYGDDRLKDRVHDEPNRRVELRFILSYQPPNRAEASESN